MSPIDRLRALRTGPPAGRAGDGDPAHLGSDPGATPPALGVVLDTTSDALVGVDADGAISFANRAAAALLGLRLGAALGMDLHEAVHPGGRCAERCAIRAGLAARRRMTLDASVWRGDEEVLVEASFSAVLPPTPTLSVVVSLRDVTERRRQLEALTEAQLRFQVAFDEAPIGMALVSTDGRYLKVNRALCRLTGYERSELEGDDPPELTHPLDVGLDAPEWHALVEGRTRSYKVEKRFLRADEDTRWVTVTAAAVATRARSRDGYVLLQVEDITGRKRAEEMLTHRALHDPLTGLANRALLMDRLRHALDVQRRTGQALAVLFCDLDRFKYLNDTLGHDVGDQLIVEVGKRIGEALSPGDTLARVGGDEFVVVAENIGDAVGAELLAAKIADLVAEPLRLHGSEITVTASIGVVLSADGGDQADALLRDADSAMYHAKTRGRARTELFDTDLRERAHERLLLETELTKAVEREELLLAYQPCVDLATGTLEGVEALVRWRRGSGEVLAPDVFLPIAEENGLIVPIGLWVLNEACRQAAAWLAEHGRIITVGVNLAARQLNRPGMAETVRRILAAHKLPPEALRLEITETVLVEAGSAGVADLAALRETGVHVGIDDFGTGYASMTYLKRFPVDFIKIDRSFVAGLGIDREDTAIVRATLSLGEALGLQTVAEGIEEPAQAEQLRMLGCDLAQGYLFGRPQTPEQISERAGVGITLP